MKLFGYEIRKYDKNQSSFYNPLTFNFMGGLGGGYNSALSLPVLFRVIELITNQISLLPLKVSVNSEIDQDHNVVTLFENHSLGKQHLIKTIVQQVITKGNSYVFIERNGITPVKLHLLDPSSVEPVFDYKTQELVYKTELSNKPIESVNMLHFKLFSYDGVKGVSIFNIGKETIEQSIATEIQAKQQFQKGYNRGILTASQNLTKQQREELQKTYGQINEDSLVVLPANLSYQKLQSTNAELQTNDNRRTNDIRLCNLLGVNPALLGLDGGSNTYSNTESLYTHFVQFTLLPYISMIEEQLNTKLLSPTERKFTTINLDEKELLRTDKRTQVELHTSYLQSGVLSINEIRSELGLKEIQGGDKHIIAYTDINQNTINSNGQEE